MNTSIEFKIIIFLINSIKGLQYQLWVNQRENASLRQQIEKLESSLLDERAAKLKAQIKAADLSVGSKRNELLYLETKVKVQEVLVEAAESTLKEMEMEIDKLRNFLDGEELESVGFWLKNENFSRSKFSDFGINQSDLKDAEKIDSFYQAIKALYNGDEERLSNLETLFRNMVAYSEVSGQPKMSNYFLFKAGTFPPVTQISDINPEEIINFPAPLMRAVTDGKKAAADLRWEEVGRFQKDATGRVSLMLYKDL